jgi:serine/threonine protein kinase
MVGDVFVFLVNGLLLTDRSSHVSSRPPSSDSALDYMEAGFGVSYMKFAGRKALIASVDGWPAGDELGQHGFGVVSLIQCPAREVRHTVKTLPRTLNARNLVQDVANREQLNHPFLFGFKAHIAGSGTRKEAIVTEFGPTDSLNDHLPLNMLASLLSLLRADTKIAIMIARIVLGMRYLNSRRFIHRDLNPDNILLD